MRHQSSLIQGLTATLALAAASIVHISVPATAADPKKQTKAPAATAPAATSPAEQPPIQIKPTGIAPALDVNDEIAALESVQLALSQVADGSSYVWHRSHGRLSGIVRPTASFKDHRGMVCRHVVVVLNGIDLTKKTEAIACRQNDGIWELDG